MPRLSHPLLCAALLSTFPVLSQAAQPDREYYQPSTWQPRVTLPAEDVLRGDFFPPSPKVDSDYNDPDFDSSRLSPVPAPGLHPRVLLTPSDADLIRAKIALGDKAPATFRSMWTRVSKKKGALYAYLVQDHELGQKLAADFMTKVRALQPKLDAMDKYPDHENLWSVERSMAAAGDPNAPSEIWQLPNYDLLYQWLSDADRDLTRKTISRITSRRSSNFLNVPDHYMINNHEGFGLAFMPLMLSIQGEEGFDQQVFNLAVRKMRAMLDFYLTKDGICYETIKGWLNISAFVAVARHPEAADILKHSHLRGKMDYFLQALRWERPNLARPQEWIIQPPYTPVDGGGAWKIRDEMRASAFHVIWMMNYFHPNSRKYDFLYQASLSSHDFLTNPDARWPDPVGIDDELLLLWAQDPMTENDGKRIDWTAQKTIDSLNLPPTWHDDQRGYLVARNSWRKDDLAVQFACKQEYYYGGHEGSEHGRFTFWADGVNWALDNNSLFYKQSALHNQVTIDGMGIKWPPVAGKWLGIQDSPAATSAAGDYKNGYSYTKSTQIHPLDFPSARVPYTAMFSAGNYTLTRNIQLAFTPEMIRFYDAYAHTDYGTWSGEARLLDGYREWNPIRRAFRTLTLGRGEKPYLLITDDIQKDDQPHEYAWNMVLPDDVILIKTNNIPDMLGGVMPADPLTQMDLILGRIDTPRNDKSGAFYTPLYKEKKGDPQLLVRMLRRNTNKGFTVPRVQQIERFNVLVIPATSISPDYITLLFPLKAGDPLPKTTWSEDGSALTIDTGKQKDTYLLAKTDAGRTVFTLQRNGQTVLTSKTPPAAPRLTVRGQTFDLSDARYSPEESRIPHYLFTDTLTVRLDRPAITTPIHYTLDGTEPTADSPRYQQPLLLQNSCTLKARVIDPSWTAGPTQSRVLTATFEKRAPAAALKSDPARPGLIAQVFELKTVIYDNNGFWRKDRPMLPDLRKEKPLLTNLVDTFELPHATPQADYIEQRKAFYRFLGFFNAPAAGVYTFSVNSCGPVTLDIANQTAIEHTGQFHQQQSVRSGEVTLSPGLQPLTLVVTDPLFWKINTDGPMPFKVTYRLNDGPEQEISPSQLSHNDSAEFSLAPPPQTPDFSPSQNLTLLEPGVLRSEFDRSADYRPFIPPPNDWLDTTSRTPLETRPATAFLPNTGDSLIVSYDGYFYAPQTGRYTFNLPTRTDNDIDRNQLRLHDQVISQHGVPGRNPANDVQLGTGYHPISIRLGKSRSDITVTFPDGQTLPLTANSLYRPVQPLVLPQGATTPATAYEIYGPSPVTLTLPPSASKLTLRYTLGGSAPTPSSPVYTAPLTIDQTTTLTALGFDNDKPATLPATVTLTKVATPTAGLALYLPGNSLDTTPLAACKPWFDPSAKTLTDPNRPYLALHGGSQATLTSGPSRAVDPNLDKGNTGAGIRLNDLKLPRNAVTIACYVRLSNLKEGKLFGKWGITAIGKRYKCLTLEVSNGTLRVDPGPVSSASAGSSGAFTAGKLSPNTWHHIAVTADSTQSTLYLDGEPIATGPGPESVTADSLDFAVNTPADLADIRLYTRVLSPRDIAKLVGK